MMINVPRINQYERYDSDGWHYCTVATTEMYLWWANGTPPGVQIAPEVYKGKGSGSFIEAALNAHSKRPATCTFDITRTVDQIRHVLAEGYPVPLGVDYLDGTIFKTGTVSRAGLVEGKPHPRADEIYGAGHWVLIVGYDMTYFYINDPDTGSTVKMSYRDKKGGIVKSTGGDGHIYAVLSKEG